jgi:HPt (histidine-containing phosphotransfer) domain-containing protein
LQSIKLNLDVLSTRPKDREALWEIKKSAHTFKGAAGVVGLRKLSDLAHRVEDLLDRLSEKNADLNVHIISLLLHAAECLETLSSAEGSSEIDAKIESLYEEFGKVLGGISPPDRTGEGPVANSPSVKFPPRRRATDLFAAPRKTNSIVRVSLDRVDDLVRNMRVWCGTGNGCNIYNPPVRNWNFDPAFNNAANLPPLTPRFVYVQQVLFTEDFK